MDNKYIIVRANSTAGAYIVERNECAPRAKSARRRRRRASSTHLSTVGAIGG